jgi:thiosulfate dehydrogenase
MKYNRFTFALVITAVFALVGAGVSLILSRFIDFSNTKSIETIAQKKGLAQQTGGVFYNPPLPQEAPSEIREAVMLGYNIMMNTPKYAASNVGNKLSCTNCHFNGGITPGGKNNGISLVGVAATYPTYKKRQNYAVDLVTRTNDCFMRSMNGKPLQSDSREMNAIVTYYHWISNGLPIYAAIPWLRLKQIKADGTPDPSKGRLTFAGQCAVCHGNNGQGTQAGPPLWGKDSYNDGAGMHQVKNFATFVKWNMPRSNPDLSTEDSRNVAAFVRTQSRPGFHRNLSGARATE